MIHRRNILSDGSGLLTAPNVEHQLKDFFLLREVPYPLKPARKRKRDEEEMPLFRRVRLKTLVPLDFHSKINIPRLKEYLETLNRWSIGANNMVERTFHIYRRRTPLPREEHQVHLVHLVHDSHG